MAAVATAAKVGRQVRAPPFVIARPHLGRPDGCASTSLSTYKFIVLSAVARLVKGRNRDAPDCNAAGGIAFPYWLDCLYLLESAVDVMVGEH